MGDEATNPQQKPQGVGRDIIKLVEEDFIALPVISPAKGLETIYMWSRSIAYYLKELLTAYDESGNVARRIIEDLEARAALGEKKYGERLKAFNGRDPRIDAYQESLDQTAYIKQIIEQLEIKK